MSSHHTHRDDLDPSLKHEIMSSPSLQSTATSERRDGIKTQDEVASANIDDDFDGGDEFRERVNAIKDAADTLYNPMNEELPKLPVYHPAFLRAVKLCTELVEGAVVVLKNAEYKDTRVSQLLQKALKSNTLEYRKPRLVGLIGDSGVGTSSLINSLLDTTDIALSGANGEACTNVITEYHEAQPSQKAPFMAEITLLEPPLMQRILMTQLGWYYRYVHKSGEIMDQEAIDELNDHVETATETFQALFADREEFSNEERTHEFLKQAQQSDLKMLQIFLDWIQESTSTCGAKDGIIRRYAHAPDELARRIERFVKSCRHLLDERDCHVPSLWPLVRVVRIITNQAKTYRVYSPLLNTKST